MSIELMLVVILVIAGILYVAHIIIGDAKESREPLYQKFQKTHFRASQSSQSKYCPICRQPFVGTWDCYTDTTLCNSCAKLTADRSVLREFNVPKAIANTCQNDHITALNIIKIDLQRGHISKEEADGLSKGVIRDMVESRSKYRKIKAKLQRTRQGRVEPWMLVKTSGDSETCRVCDCSRYGVCDCKNEFLVAYDQDKIPSQLRTISQAALKLNRPEIGFWFEDWAYLKLIADDFGQGIISGSEAKRERDNYIEVVYHDAKRRLDSLELQNKVTEEMCRDAERASKNFMDETLS